MSPNRLKHLLGLLGHLSKKWHKSKKTNSCSRTTHASGDLPISLSYLFWMGKKSEAIIQVLLQDYMSPPETEGQGKNMGKEFGDLWQFPHVVRAIDGKHVVNEALGKSDTLYHNYKWTFSFLVLAECDTKCNFTLVHIGQYGSNNDSGILAQSKISSAFENNTLNLAESEIWLGANLDNPYFLVGDEIFVLKPWLLRLYPGRLLQILEMIYNYRYSRARMVIKNAFGILRDHWRILSHPLKASVQNTERYVMACLCLHNYFPQSENFYTPQLKALLMSNWWMIKLGKENEGYRPG